MNGRQLFLRLGILRVEAYGLLVVPDGLLVPAIVVEDESLVHADRPGGLVVGEVVRPKGFLVDEQGGIPAALDCQAGHDSGGDNPDSGAGRGGKAAQPGHGQADQAGKG